MQSIAGGCCALQSSLDYIEGSLLVYYNEDIADDHRRRDPHSILPRQHLLTLSLFHHVKSLHRRLMAPLLFAHVACCFCRGMRAHTLTECMNAGCILPSTGLSCAKMALNAAGQCASLPTPSRSSGHPHTPGMVQRYSHFASTSTFINASDSTTDHTLSYHMIV